MARLFKTQEGKGRGMQPFRGFRRHATSVTVPDAFVADLLPNIADLRELKVTLAAFRVLSRKTGSPRAATWSDMAAEPGLRGMSEADIAAGIEMAVERGTVLHWAEIDDDGLYFANTESGRAAVQALARGERVMPVTGPLPKSGKIFSLYEQHIGVVPPLLADELRQAADRYPPIWITEAFREAVRHNAPTWAYVSRILETRSKKTKRYQVGTADRRKKYAGGQYAALIQC